MRLTHLSVEWHNIQPMQTPRQLLAAVNCNGIVYAIGGRCGKKDSTALKSVEKFNSAGNQWNYVSDMNIGRCAHAAFVLRGKVYVVGGLDADGYML